MRFADAIRSIGLSEAEAAPLRAGWEASMDAFPEDTPDFLRPRRIAESREWSGLPAEAEAVALEAAEKARRDPALLRLLWHVRRLLFDDGAYPTSKVREWPELEAQLGALSGAFYLLALLDTVPRARQRHRERGIPDDVSRLTCSDIAVLAERYRRFHPGRWGAPVDTLQWLRNHAEGTLFRLGRLQYQPRPFGGKLRVYRSRQTGETIALAEDSCGFDQRGFRVLDEGPFAREPAWVSRLAEADGVVRGNPISPEGHALRAGVALDLSEWEFVLGEGVGVLQMHIPAGERLSVENTGASMRRAAEFFPKYFPDTPFRAFACSSWLFNTQFEEILDERSNIVRWQRDTYLYPLPRGGHAGLRFIFGKDDPDLARAPRDTRLRRGALEIIERGERLRSGGMLYLPEDLPAYGAGHYRRQWPALLERVREG